MSSQQTAPGAGPPMFQELEESAVRFARGAGEIVLRHFRTALKVEYKSRGHTSPVTVADRESEEYLRSVISERYPDHSILGEEGVDLLSRGSEYTWVLDPVDGTANFISGLPLFAVSIGVLHEGEPVAAAVFVPTSGLLTPSVYHTHRGGPAYLDDTEISVASGSTMEASRLAALPGYFHRRMRFSGEMRGSPGDPRTLGSIAVEMAFTASGTLQYAYFNRPKIWDVAAGVLLVRQAGGLCLFRPRRFAPWLPLDRFRTPQGTEAEPGRLRDWGASIVIGNPEIAWGVAGSVQSRSDLLRPVSALVSKAKQLPLIRNS